MLRVPLCAELTAASLMLEPFGEVVAYFSLQLSLQRQFAKVKNRKKLSPKINVKNIKKIKFNPLFVNLLLKKGAQLHSGNTVLQGYKTIFILNSAEHIIYPARIISMINTTSERLKVRHFFIW